MSKNGMTKYTDAGNTPLWNVDLSKKDPYYGEICSLRRTAGIKIKGVEYED